MSLIFQEHPVCIWQRHTNNNGTKDILLPVEDKNLPGNMMPVCSKKVRGPSSATTKRKSDEKQRPGRKRKEPLPLAPLPKTSKTKIVMSSSSSSSSSLEEEAAAANSSSGALRRSTRSIVTGHSNKVRDSSAPPPKKKGRPRKDDASRIKCSIVPLRATTTATKLIPIDNSKKKSASAYASSSLSKASTATKKKRTKRVLDVEETLKNYRNRLILQKRNADFEIFRDSWISDFKLHEEDKRDAHHVSVLLDILKEKNIPIAGITTENKKDGRWLEPFLNGVAREEAKVVYIGAKVNFQYSQRQESEWNIMSQDKVSKKMNVEVS